MNRRFESGAAKRRKLQRWEKERQRIEGTIDSFIIKTTKQTDTSDTREASTSQTQVVFEEEIQASRTHIPIPHDNDVTVDYSDPGNWPKVMSSELCADIVAQGPFQVSDIVFPKDVKNRHFSVKYYKRQLPNDETVARKWLVYSLSQNKVFCFACKLFSTSYEAEVSKLTGEGDCAWQELSKTLKVHETSKKHIDYILNLHDLSKRLLCHETIDEKELQLYSERVRYWKGILERIIAIVVFLSSRNLAFRGSCEKLNCCSKYGNFLGQVELMAKFDNQMQQHIESYNDKRISDHYLGVHIQNELIQILSNAVKDKIVAAIHASKYYAIMLDCTTDVNHVEQMTILFRFVEITDSKVDIKEHFMGYVDIHDSSGKGMTEIILEVLSENDIDLANMRAQCYDNGANMARKHNGVQAHILNMNSRAFFSPCLSHTLNLLVCDAAKSSTSSLKFFGTIQRLFVFFSSSSKRWDVLKRHSTMTVKSHCDTRWESRIESLETLRYNLPAKLKSLNEVAEKSKDPVHYSEAQSLSETIASYSFIVSVNIWFDLLFEINIVSKHFQSRSASLDNSTILLSKLIDFISKYRQTGLKSAEIDANDVCEELLITKEYPIQRSRRKKKLFDYEGRDEPIETPAKIFQIEFFLPLVDSALKALQERFKLLERHNDVFSFLYMSSLSKLTDQCLSKKCKDVETKLTDITSMSKDINANDLCREIHTLTRHLEDKNEYGPIDTLKYIVSNTLIDSFPNVFIVLRILLTIPASVASAERSFSKLKLTKTYLRSNMSQERLNGMSMISIENEICSSINKEQIIDAFAKKKARKVPFS